MTSESLLNNIIIKVNRLILTGNFKNQTNVFCSQQFLVPGCLTAHKFRTKCESDLRILFFHIIKGIPSPTYKSHKAGCLREEYAKREDGKRKPKPVPGDPINCGKQKEEVKGDGRIWKHDKAPFLSVHPIIP